MVDPGLEIGPPAFPHKSVLRYPVSSYIPLCKGGSGEPPLHFTVGYLIAADGLASSQVGQDPGRHLNFSTSSQAVISYLNFATCNQNRAP